MNPEFEVHLLNKEGIAKAQKIASIFDSALNSLLEVIPPRRYLSIVRTKLEEAAFFAKKGLAIDRDNQV